MAQRFPQKFFSILLGGIIIAAFITFLDPLFGTEDLSVYWIIGRALNLGQNPYDISILSDIAQREWPSAPPNPFFHPPWSAWIFSLLALIPSTLVPTTLLFCSVVGVIASHYLLWGSAQKPNRIQFLALVSFYPIFVVLQLGQITILPLLGLCLFLSLQNGATRVASQSVASKKLDFISGLCLSLTFLKPNLLYLYYLWLVIFCIRQRRWPLIGGFGLGIMLMVCTTVVFRPELWLDFIRAPRSPFLWQTPTIGAWLQNFLPTFFAHSIPLVVAILAVTAVAIRSKNPTLFPLLLLPVTLLTTPYLWLYDFAMLLPAVCFLVFRSPRLSSLLVAAHLLLLLGPRDMQYAVWYPIFVLILLWQNSFREGAEA